MFGNQKAPGSIPNYAELVLLCTWATNLPTHLFKLGPGSQVSTVLINIVVNNNRNCQNSFLTISYNLFSIHMIK